MRNSPASSLFTCRAQLSHACEKPWMKRISGPFGLPHSCAAIVTPSGVFTVRGLYFLSCAAAEAASAAIKTVAWLTLRNAALAFMRFSSSKSFRGPRLLMRVRGLDHLEPLVVAHHVRPERVDVLQHLVRHLLVEAGHRLFQRVDAVAIVVGRQHGRVDADVRGEAADGDVADAFRAQHVVQARAAEAAHLDARREEEIRILRSGLDALEVRRLLAADLPGLARDLIAVKGAGVGPVELAIV